MAKTLLKLFSKESFAGGGEFFKDGLYKVEKSLFVMYDFNGKVKGKDGDGLICLALKLQPVDKDHKDSGDAVMQYWSIGTEDATIENKGKGIALTGDYTTLWKLSDYSVFVEYWAKNGGDQDALEDENDISVLAGNVFEFGKVDSPRTSRAKDDDKDDDKKDAKKGPNKIVIVTDAVPKGGGKSSSSSKSDKDKDTKSDKKEDAKKSDKDSKKSGSSDSEECEEIIKEYLAKKVFVKKNEEGIEMLPARMGLNAFVQKEKKGDTDLVKAVSKTWSDDLVQNCAESVGWELDGDVLKKSE